MDAYAKFRNDVERCMGCELAKYRQHVVVDRGNPEAKIALIGEAPGEQEDEEGLAFVGRSGDLLDDVLYEAGLEPETDVIIFNVLKCRPPKNDFPMPAVVKKCLPHLDRQIGLVNPRVVVLVGKAAADYLVWRPYPMAPKMEDLAGRWIQAQQHPLIDFTAIYHPAYLLRLEDKNPDAFEAERERTILALMMARGFLDGEEPDQEPLVSGSPYMIEDARKAAGR